MKLAERGPDILPLIEKVLRKRVTPSLDAFLGLNYVLGAYAVVACRAGRPGVVDFFRSLPPPLEEEARRVLPAFFRELSDGWSFDVAPSPELRAYAGL